MAEDETPSDHKDTTEPATGAQDRGIFLPLVFGGAIAAALGFFGSQIDSVERALGLAPPDDGLRQIVETQAAQISGQEQRIAALSEELRSLPEPPPPTDLSAVEGQLSDLSAQIAELADRVEVVEKRPMTDNVSREAIAAYEKELERLQSAVAKQRAEIEALLNEARETESEAERKARTAQARAIVARIIAAVDSGESFSSELADLQSSGGMEVPEVLAETAADGVATLGELQARFPDVARSALDAARREEAATGNGGFGAFLERQLGARSVTPQEGDDPDSVLSRAEADVRLGRLSDALAEIDALPDSARKAMGDWISKAATRHDAIRAAQALMTALAAH